MLAAKTALATSHKIHKNRHRGLVAFLARLRIVDHYSHKRNNTASGRAVTPAPDTRAT
jgi:hypothetical protein